MNLAQTRSALSTSSPSAVLRESVERARSIAELGAFITIADEGCQAEQVARLDAVREGVLTGIPIAVKDNIDTYDLPTSGGTPALAHSCPQRDHPAVQRLRAAGATVVGKTNLHELALGITCNNSAFGPVRNPHDIGRIAGGSSGGSAAAVAAGVVPVALGSDTGGSVGVPAAHCGIVGFRPSVGRWGSGSAVPISSTRDTVGGFATSVGDVAELDQVITGGPRPPLPEGRALRLGVPRTGYWDDLSPEVAACVGDALDRLADAGFEIVDVDLSDAHELDGQCGFPIVLYEVVREVPAYLASLPKPEKDLTLDDLVSKVASPDVRAALEAAIAEPVSEDAYRQSFVVRERLQGAYARAVLRADGGRVDALVYPTVPLTAAPLGDDSTTEHNGREVPTFLTNIRNTAPGSTAGMPAISVPAGRSSDGLPIGLSLEALQGEDAMLLAVAEEVEKALAGGR